MRKLTKRISLAAASAAVAGGAVLGAGGTASAATPVDAPVQRSVVSVKADDHRRHDEVTYRHDQKKDYCRDGYRTRQHRDWDCCTDEVRYDRHGHFYRWDDEDCGWKHDRGHRDGWNRSNQDWGRDL
jgi:hypothetical protein